MPKENKRFINPLLRPSQDQPQPDSTVAPTSDVVPPREEQETARDHRASAPSPSDSQSSNDVSYPSGNAHASVATQVVNESPSLPIADTRATNTRPSESDTDKVARPVATAGRSASRPSTARSSSGRNVAREDAAREPASTNTRPDERGDVEEDHSQGYRRRVEVRFEHMHERLTVWIDRDLKRGLEDLASKRNLSKTALINEAMADLLKKHKVD